MYPNITPNPIPHPHPQAHPSDQRLHARPPAPTAPDLMHDSRPSESAGAWPALACFADSLPSGPELSFSWFGREREREGRGVGSGGNGSWRCYGYGYCGYAQLWWLVPWVDVSCLGSGHGDDGGIVEVLLTGIMIVWTRHYLVVR